MVTSSLIINPNFIVVRAKKRVVIRTIAVVGAMIAFSDHTCLIGQLQNAMRGQRLQQRLLRQKVAASRVELRVKRPQDAIVIVQVQPQQDEVVFGQYGGRARGGFTAGPMSDKTKIGIKNR